MELKTLDDLDGGQIAKWMEQVAAVPGVIYHPRLEETRQRVIDLGGMITQEIFSFPGGRRFHFTEPSGNECAIWSEELSGRG